MKKKFLTSIAILATTAVACISMAACDSSDASAAARSTEQTISRTSSVMKSIDGIEMNGDHNELSKTLEQIKERNERIAQRKNDIASLLSESKKLRHDLRKERKNKSINEETYNDIRQQGQDIRRNVERLKNQRNDAKKLVKTRHKASEKIEVGQMNNHFQRVLQRLDQKIELMDKTETDIRSLNRKMRSALGQPEQHTHNNNCANGNCPTFNEHNQPSVPSNAIIRGAQRLPFFFV